MPDSCSILVKSDEPVDFINVKIQNKAEHTADAQKVIITHPNAHKRLIQAQKHGAGKTYDPVEHEAELPQIIIVLIHTLCNKAVSNSTFTGGKEYIKNAPESVDYVEVVLKQSKRHKAQKSRNHQSICGVENHTRELGRKQIANPVSDVSDLLLGKVPSGAVIGIHLGNNNGFCDVFRNLEDQQYSEIKIIVLKENQDKDPDYVQYYVYHKGYLASHISSLMCMQKAILVCK